MRNFHIGGKNDVRSAHKIHFHFKSSAMVIIVGYGVDAALHTGVVMMIAYLMSMVLEGGEIFHLEKELQA